MRLFLRVDPRTRAALWISLWALAVHLVPLFLPRKVPAVELDLARVLPDGRHRIPFLAPLRENPQSRGEHLRAAAELVLDASTREARDFLLEARRRDPGALENILLEARICHAEGDEPCVHHALARARSDAPADPRPELLDAELREVAGDVAGSLLALERALDKAPGDVALRLRYAHALGTAGREADADAALDALAPDLPRHRLLLEQALLRLAGGRNEEARALLQEAASADGGNAAVRYYLGVALFRLEEWDRAEVELRISDRLDPTDFRALALLCALQRAAGRTDDASISRAMLERRFASRRAEFDAACPP
jgi:tetratricopeptide (TPR) repeat protein